MTVAIVITKIPIVFGESFGPLVLRDLSTYGFWSMAYEMRTDFAMWMGSLYLIIKSGEGIPETKNYTDDYSHSIDLSRLTCSAIYSLCSTYVFFSC